MRKGDARPGASIVFTLIAISCDPLAPQTYSVSPSTTHLTTELLSACSISMMLPQTEPLQWHKSLDKLTDKWHLS